MMKQEAGGLFVSVACVENEATECAVTTRTPWRVTAMTIIQPLARDRCGCQTENKPNKTQQIR